MELEEKIMQVIYDSGYEPVLGNHKRGHVDVTELKEKLVTLFGVHYNDFAGVLAGIKTDHVQEKERIYGLMNGYVKELAMLRTRNWYQRLFNLK